MGCTEDAPDLTLTEFRGTAFVEGRLLDFCFCAPGTCRTYDGRTCRTRYLPGDSEHLTCAEIIPRHDWGGRCLRECDTSSDCRPGMECLDLHEALGSPYTMERACFDVSLHVDE
ncbi:MAG: hypothetical protein SFX73_10600 [Kofleriaceae bacterium]|nr:hypothetical protein [Kofleriaceae bacterium]